jgi:hypothetical protein
MPTYYIQWKGVVEGPYQAASILQMLESNRISKMHLISSDRRNWMALGKSPILTAPVESVGSTTGQSSQVARSKNESGFVETVKNSSTCPQNITNITKRSDPRATLPREREVYCPTSTSSNQSSPAFITGLCCILGIITLVVILGRPPQSTLQSPEYPPQARVATVDAWAAFQSADAALRQYDAKIFVSQCCQDQANRYAQIILNDVDPKLQEHILQRGALWQSNEQVFVQLEAKVAAVKEGEELSKIAGAVLGVIIGGGQDPLSDAATGVKLAEMVAGVSANLQLKQVQQDYQLELQKLGGNLRQMNEDCQKIRTDLSKKYQIELKIHIKSNDGEKDNG